MGRDRTRSSVAFDGTGYYQLLYNGNIIDQSISRKRNFNATYTVDDTHPLWNLKDSSGRRNSYLSSLDIGGVFDSISVKHSAEGTNVELSDDGFIGRRYAGPLRAYFLFSVPDNESTPMSSGSIVATMPEQIDSVQSRFAQGGTAIARCSPAHPAASLTVSVSELVRDGVPSILSQIGSARQNIEAFRGLGKDYLNLEFGWKPFVSDLRKLASAVVDQEKILDDLSRNSGKRVRRRYAFAEVSNTTEDFDNLMPWPLMDGGQVLLQASHMRRTRSTKKTWFSGEFVYRVPPLNSIGGVGAKARHLLGLDLTPKTLYDAAPWTWLGDWVANSGDVLSNISAMSADDLVMRYGYLMQETSYRVESTHTGLQARRFGFVPSTISGSVTFTRKTRVPASPFGFGLTNEDFTPRQWAVLGALGISRGR